MAELRLSDIDELIQRGQGAKARSALRRRTEQRVRRADRLEVARLARRAHLHLLALRLLHPLVYPSGTSPEKATDAEIAEYAASLSYVGPSEEALRLLEGVRVESAPEALLFRSFAHFSRWEYAAAIPLLRRYVHLPRISAYQRLVGKINLASALVYEREHRRADALLREVLYDSSLRKAKLALGNVLSLAASNAILAGKKRSAEVFLARAEACLAETDGLEALFVDKWRAIARNDLFRLRQVRRRAEALGHWETLRDCDRFEALGRKNEKLLWRIYFGTPFDSFRARLLRDFGPGTKPPKEFVWRVGTRQGSGAGKEPVRIALAGGAGLKVGQGLHRLLSVLASDFYRPFRLPMLHGELYPGEIFNPNSSPARIKNLLGRLRDWFRAERLPLEVAYHHGFYRLVATGPVEIRVPERMDFGLGELEGLPSGEFTLSRAVSRLGVSERTALRLLQRGMERGLVRRLGSGPATRYRILREQGRAAGGG